MTSALMPPVLFEFTFVIAAVGLITLLDSPKAKYELGSQFENEIISIVDHTMLD